jgi:hypothetical protein
MAPGSGTGFQSFVNNELPPGVAGDFAGANIRANVLASAWGFVAGPSGVLVGLGAWANPATGLVTNYFQPNSFPGFVHREGQALITQYLGVASMLIQPADAVTLFDQGDFWGIFSAGAPAGLKVYFDPVTGGLTADVTGNTVTASASTGSTISSNVLTTTDADVTGTIAAGQIVTGAGIPPGTYILSANSTGSGTHLWNLANVDGTAIPNIGSAEATNFYGVQESNWSVASPVQADCAITSATLALPAAGAAFGVLTVSTIGSGSLAPGQFLSSTGSVPVPASANLQIIQQLTGTAGGTGTYLTNNTDFHVSSGQAFVATQGKLGKITSWTSN